MLSDSLRVTPQQIDPLSWIARPMVSLAFAVLAFAYGISATLLGWARSGHPWLDLLAVVLVTGACLFVQFSTGPLKPPFGPARAWIALLITAAGLFSSTIAAAVSPVPVQLWWAPVGVGLVIAACAPHSTVIELAVYGAILSVLTGFATWYAFVGRDDPWTGLATIVIAVSSVIVATIASCVFCFEIARKTQRLLARAGVPVEADEAARTQAARAAELSTLARLGSRVAPFLAKVADAGEVTAADRALAGQLARRLRSDLVSQANSSWLDSLAVSGRLYIVDPDHRADRLNAAQRAAVRGLVLAVMRDPVTDTGSLFIELRGQEDGSTAVALSLDIDLPEGRRVMMLAPYYLALKTAVPEISWDPVQDLLRFRVPPGDRW